MFENILGHQRIIAQLSQEVAHRCLPGGLLFYGDPYTGKLSTALELARVLTCKKKGAWSCDCSSCRQHRVLDHPYVLMLGSRYFSEETAAAGNALLRSRSEGSRFLFIRAVRKLTRRFDPLLWEGNEQKLKKIQDPITKLEEELENYYPEAELPSESKLEKSLKKIYGACAELEKVVPRDTIPIDQIRAVNSWVHTTSSNQAKIVILENADKMGDASRNALLKTLEEPPEGTYFILLSSRKGRILPTIISRVRQYYFARRTPETAEQVMRKIFRIESPEYRNLRAFFLAWRGVPLERLRAQSEHFFSYVWGDAEWEPEKLDEFLQDSQLKIYFVPFLKELSDVLGDYMTDPDRQLPVSYAVLERWNRKIKDALISFEHYNQAPDLLLEGLLYSMKEMV